MMIENIKAWFFSYNGRNQISGDRKTDVMKFDTFNHICRIHSVNN